MYVSTTSSRFIMNVATRSPYETPRSASALASRVTRSSSWRNVRSSSPNLSARASGVLRVVRASCSPYDIRRALFSSRIASSSITLGPLLFWLGLPAGCSPRRSQSASRGSRPFVVAHNRRLVQHLEPALEQPRDRAFEELPVRIVPLPAPVQH